MTIQEVGLLLVAVVASSFGQLFLKLGAMQLGKVTGENVLAHVLKIASTPYLLAGLAAYGIGAVAYILLLTRVKLSVAAPANSLIYVTSVLIGYWVFKEVIPPLRLAGLGFIVMG
ncbi:MAG TPA: EamA-like transporter family protein, partial [Leptolyngbyaceae cyanobacterium M65_K2018_010]|nr:EamA-like transporter family protein [Leptolyngbyaceae cyanobacterium M65_K2018_010]